MTQIKSDLICEIIRKSQTRFLNNKGWTAERDGGAFRSLRAICFGVGEE